MAVYFDHNATTPMHPDVLAAMLPFYQEQFGNASCLYQLGVNASYAVEKARLQVARLINASEREIIFTSGGTESDNLAIKGVFFSGQKKHLVISAIEHPAVTATCHFLQKYLDAEITTLPVDSNGHVDPGDVEKSIKPQTALVSIMMANNEIGSIQPIQQIAKITRGKGVLLHTDAVQAIGKISVDVKQLDVDLLSLAAHKFNGPKGMGALYVRDGVEIVAQSTGGGHEYGLRGGTENVPGIVGMGKAAQIAHKNLAEYAAKVTALRDYFWKQLQQLELKITKNSPDENVLPNTLNITIPGVNARELVRAMDHENFCIASGSACSTGKPTPSTAIIAIGKGQDDALASIRLSLSSTNTYHEIDQFVNILPKVSNRVSLHQINLSVS